ncbi:hypothetical protein BGZ58_005461 [Dissophora ornata]|nr:hypothetical protein BGZ58_005461 [Dissophora ornata]
MPSDADRETFAQAPSGGLTRSTPIMPLGMPPMTKEAKESKEQAQAWDASLNRIFQTMHGEDTAKYLTYFKARLEVEETYVRSLEKLVASAKGGSRNSIVSHRDSSYSTGANNVNAAEKGQGGNGTSADPEEIPTTLQMAYDAMLDTTLQLYKRRRPFLRLLKTLTGALASLKEAHEKQRKGQKETVRPVFQLYAETRLSTVPKLKRAYEQRCREVEQVLAIEDSDHLPVRERLKNLASSTGAAGRLVKCKRDMEEADSEYKTAVQSLEVYRVQRERYFESSFQIMQNMIKERETTSRQCLEAYVNGERELISGAKEDIDRFSIVVDCVKPASDMDQISMTFTKDIHSHPKPVPYENYYQKPIPGLRREGIYRVSGRHALIMSLKKQFEINEEAVDLTDPSFSEDAASIAAVLKIYLRELPEPLFPFSLNERIAYSGNRDTNIRLHELKGRLKRLPDCNIDALQFLIQHLRRVYQHVDDNKMTLDNISMIFTPAIFHDFNSALVGGGQQGGSNTSTALSFASQTTSATSPPAASSPSFNTASWSGHSPPSSDHYSAVQSKQQQQQQQPLHQLPPITPQNLSLGFSNSASSSPMLTHDLPPGLMSYTPPPSGPNNGMSYTPPPSGSIAAGMATVVPHPGAHPNINQSVNAHSAPSTMSSTSSMSTSPTQPSFAPPTNTVSAAASWSNDLVLADLILNSDTIFNVLPNLPARTNSMMAMDERLLASLANTSMGNNGNNNGSSATRPFDNSRKSSSSSLVEGTTPLRPRMDSLGPNYSNRITTLTSTAPSIPIVAGRDVDQQYQNPQQQQQQQPYLPPPQPQQPSYPQGPTTGQEGQQRPQNLQQQQQLLYQTAQQQQRSYGLSNDAIWSGEISWMINVASGQPPRECICVLSMFAGKKIDKSLDEEFSLSLWPKKLMITGHMPAWTSELQKLAETHNLPFVRIFPSPGSSVENSELHDALTRNLNNHKMVATIRFPQVGPQAGLVLIYNEKQHDLIGMLFLKVPIPNFSQAL